MMLTMPPKARPCSAPNPLLTTRNSLTASWEGVARWEPVTVLMVSAPSTVTRLLKSRMPPTEMRVTSDSVKVDCRLVRPVVTPGVSRTKSVNSRPLIGSDSIWLVLITWLTSVRVGSTGGVSVVTTTFSVPAATLTVTSIVATCPTVRTMPVWVDFANPDASVVNSYRPGGILASTYNPFSFETPVYVRLVSVSRSVMVALATVPPLSSRTDPFNCAELPPTCPNEGFANPPRTAIPRTAKNP